MNKKSSQLAERRQLLLQLTALQRTGLAQQFKPWRKPLALADHGINMIRSIKRYPAMLLLGAFVITVLRVKHTGRWLNRIWVVWQVSNRLFKD